MKRRELFALALVPFLPKPQPVEVQGGAKTWFAASWKDENSVLITRHPIYFYGPGGSAGCGGPA